MKTTGIGGTVLMAMLGVLAIGLIGEGAAHAATASITAIPPRRAAVKPLSPQQVKARRCYREAYTRRLNGTARQDFVRYCLKQPLPTTATATAARPPHAIPARATAPAPAPAPAATRTPAATPIPADTTPTAQP